MHSHVSKIFWTKLCINPLIHRLSTRRRGRAVCFTGRGVAWVRILECWRHIFILNFSIPACSKRLSGSHANEIKHDHFSVVIVVLDPGYD